MNRVKDEIFSVGIRDWELRHFHGHELSTHRGSTYNSYLIKDEKNILVDTVWDPFMETFTDKLDEEIGLKNIDAIVINHIEPDHGGSLGYIMSKIPDTPIYCTKNGAEIIKRHFQKDWKFNIVKTGDTLKTGKYELLFLEMQMLHWPDSMATFVKGPNVLLSMDAFGQHYAPERIFNDEVDNGELYEEAIKYYANILAPFNALIKKKVEQIRELNLPIEMIAPSHGIIWRKDPMQIVDKYYQWSQDYNEGNVVIFYDTMYNSTKKVAETIAEGIQAEGTDVKLFNTSIDDVSDLITEIFKAKGVIGGSCTVNNSVLRSVAAVLTEIKGHKFKNKFAAAFGSYGWSGEGAKVINSAFEDTGMKIVNEPIQVRYRANPEELAKCLEFGKQFARALK